MNKTVKLLALALVSSAFAVACGSSDDSGDPAESAGSAGAGGSTAGAGGSAAGAGGSTAGAGGSAAGAGGSTAGAGGSTAGAGGSTAGAGGSTAGAGGSTAGAGGSTAGAAGAVSCPTFANAGSPVPETAGPGAMPTAAGGTIADGTYVLTKWDIYPPGAIDKYLRKETYVVSGNTVQIVTQRDNDPEQRSAGTFTTSGTSVTLNVTCPTTASVTVGYTATPTTLQFFETAKPSTQEVHTYTKKLVRPCRRA